MTKNTTYGLLISEYVEHGYNHVKAELICREDGYDYPRNPSDWISEGPLKGLYLSNLGMLGFCSNYDAEFIGYEPAYNHPYRVKHDDAKRMVKTLNRVFARIDKDDAREPGDMFLSLCHALNLDFVVVKSDGSSIGGGLYSDSRWQWLSVGEGRNRYRAMVEQAKANTKTERSSNVA
jgi:hypothetical protein